MTEPVDVHKAAAYLPTTAEQLAEAQEIGDTLKRWLAATPEQRAAWAIEADQRRREQREQAEPVALTLDALLAKLGWTVEYARHYVQRYCGCSPDMDGGWYLCQHAEDLGLTTEP